MTIRVVHAASMKRSIEFAILLTLLFPSVSRSDDGKANQAWRKIWAFEIHPTQDGNDRYSSWMQGRSNIQFSGDGTVYHREGKLHEFTTNKLLGLLPTTEPQPSRRLFDSPVDSSLRWVSGTKAYRPFGVGDRPLICVEDGAVKTTGDISEAIGDVELAKVAKGLFVSRDGTRVVYVQDKRLTFLEWNPENRKEIRRKSAIFSQDVDRLEFIDGTNSVLICTTSRVTEQFAYIWDTESVIVEAIHLSLKNVNWNYQDVLTISPDGRTMILVDNHIDAPGARTTNLAHVAEKAVREGKFEGILYLYDVVSGKLSEKRFPHGVSRACFLDANTVAFTYFNDPRKTDWTSNESQSGGWVTSPTGNNGVKSYSLREQTVTTLIPAKDLRERDDVIAIYGTPANIVLVKKRGNTFIQLEAFTNNNVDIASEDVVQEETAKLSHFPIKDQMVMFYESVDEDDSKGYMRRIFNRRNTETGTQWVCLDQFSNLGFEKQTTNYKLPFPIYSNGGTGHSLSSLGIRDGMLESSDLDDPTVVHVLLPVKADGPRTWQYSYRQPAKSQLNPYTLTSSSVSPERAVVVRSEARVDNKSGSLIVESEYEASSTKNDKDLYSRREIYAAEIGLKEFINFDGTKFRLVAARDPESTNARHHLERTIFSGIERNGDDEWNLLISLYDFQSGKFKASVILKSKRAGQSDLGPFAAEGSYQGDKIQFEFSFEKNRPKKAFSGAFDNGSITGTLDFITVHNQVVRQKFSASQIHE